MKLREKLSSLKILLLLPLVAYVVYLEDGTIRIEGLMHWLVHLSACVLVCELFHSSQNK